MDFTAHARSGRFVPSVRRAMKTRLLFLLFVLAATALRAADLPTLTLEHLYYLQARAERVRKFKPDEMIEYCLAQKIGGNSFDNLNAQLLTLRVELARLVQIEQPPDTDPRVAALRKQSDVLVSLLREEAQKVQNGVVREGQIAADTLQTIARAQSSR